MTLNHLRGIPIDRHALDHVRIKRALGEKFVTAVFTRAFPAIFLEQFLGRLLKYPNEFVADDFSFGFWIGHAFEQREETLTRIHVFQTHMEIFAENALHDFFLARAQQTIVHKDTCKLVADRLVQKRRGNG